MFDYADTPFNGRQPVAADDVHSIDAAIAALGLTPPTRYGDDRRAVCGVAERVSVRDVLECEGARKSLLRRISRLIRAGIPVSISPQDFRARRSCIDSWQHFCELIGSALSRRGLSGRDVGFCIHSHQLPLEAYCLIADVVLGPGPRFVFLDSLQMRPHGSPEAERRSVANWQFLWRHHSARRPVMPVYGGIVRSACPLLADEVAAAVLPGRGLHGPLASAWFPITLPITAFSSGDGRIRWQELREAIRKVLLLVEQGFDQVRWQTPGQRLDATQNRRLAFEVTEIGELALRRGDDPARLDCLNRLAATIGRIRNELRDQSRQIAAACGAIPALTEANHVEQWIAGPHRDSWSRHWEAALQRSAVRYRNLLVMSPYSVIPGGTGSSPEFSDLLPVIGLADAWTFAEPPDFRGWNATRFRQFHRRARAIIQQSHTASFVAAGV